MRTLLRMEPVPGFEPEIGCWLWALEDTRQRTLTSVTGLAQQAVDWEGPHGGENAIGSLLYHIALVEMSWLFMDIFEEDLPESVRHDFPHAMATEGHITRVLSVPIDAHVARLTRGRSVLLQALRGMSRTEWHTLREPDGVNYSVSPAWAIFHLIEHEAAHAAQIRSLKARAARLLARK